MRHPIFLVTAAVCVLLGAAAVFLLVQDRQGASIASTGTVNTGGAAMGGPFELTSTQGERVTAEDLIDGPTLIYFGYTFCPDVCPIDTQLMIDAVEIAAGNGIDVTPVFITIDPERDTVEELGGFVEAMHPKLVGLTGTPEEIKVAADAYRVFYRKVDAPDSAADYLVNHTAYTYYMLPDGLGALFRHNTPPEEMAAEIERIAELRGFAG